MSLGLNGGGAAVAVPPRKRAKTLTSNQLHLLTTKK